MIKRSEYDKTKVRVRTCSLTAKRTRMRDTTWNAIILRRIYVSTLYRFVKGSSYRPVDFELKYQTKHRRRYMYCRFKFDNVNLEPGITSGEMEWSAERRRAARMTTKSGIQRIKNTRIARVLISISP
jgi:hypothetical protein